MDPEDIIPLEDTSFEEGMPDFVGSNYASPIDHFWQTEIEYNGTTEK
jgi:hypothetical protein